MSVEAAREAQVPNLDTPGAPAFPGRKRVLGRKRLMRATSESDSDSADTEESGGSSSIGKRGFHQVARSTGIHDSDNVRPISAEPSIKKRLRCGSSICLETSPACRFGDQVPATSSYAGPEVLSGDVEYIKTERVVLTQVFLTAWRLGRGREVGECEYIGVAV